MKRLAVFCAVIVVPLVAGPAQAQRDDLDRLARRLEREVRELREEVIVHFKGRPGFREMEEHTREIERQANRITKLTDRDARRRILREALDRMEDEVRHVNRHILELGRGSGIDRRAYDHLRDEFTDVER